MTTYYIDFQGGAAVAGTTEGAPRNDLPTAVAGDVWRFKRGSSVTRTSQYGINTSLLLTDYGNPAAPKPVFSVSTTGSTSGINVTQDLIAHNINFTGFQPASNAGHAINFAVRGGGASNSGPGAGGIFLGCDFSNIKGNAVQANPNDGSTPSASSDFMALLDCTFDNIGDDALFLKVSRYLEVGWCDIRRVSQLTTTGDCIHNMDAFLQYAWIHDNVLDHSDIDSKQCIMLDDPTAGMPLGLALVERNVILGAGTNLDDNIASTLHNPVNIQARTVFRQNYVRTKNFGVVLGAGAPQASAYESEVYGNIFDVMANKTAQAALTSFNNAKVFNNTFWRRNTAVAGEFCILTASTAPAMDIQNNIIANFPIGIQTNAPTVKAVKRNAYYNVASREVLPVMSGITLDTMQRNVLPSDLKNVARQDFRPASASLFFKSFDRRFPDFFGRYGSEGIGYLGAVTGAF